MLTKLLKIQANALGLINRLECVPFLEMVSLFQEMQTQLSLRPVLSLLEVARQRPLTLWTQ